MLKYSLITLFAISFAFLQSSCKSVAIKDMEFCVDKGPLGARCFHTLSVNERAIPAYVWDELAIGEDHRFAMVCGSAENFSAMKKTILDLCAIGGNCRYELLESLERFDNELQKQLQINTKKLLRR